ncbi:MAG TPA: endonuclease/exonuclease/phosphatase family protein [Pyrinomonadaceae bacterium]
MSRLTARRRDYLVAFLIAVALLFMTAIRPAPFAGATSLSPPSPRIREIQGAKHLSPLVNSTVSDVNGIVTATRSNGFYMQDAVPDADPRTSEGIFVFTNKALSNVSVGDSVSVSGRVTEHRQGDNAETNANLSVTQISSPTVTVLSHGNPLPAPVVIGRGGRIPPSTIIEDDVRGNVETSGDFDPASDGIDFYESLEGMLVKVNNAVVVGPTFTPRSGAKEIPVIADNGRDAGLRTARGGIIVRANDFNPERIFLSGELTPLSDLDVGDSFSGAITGVMDYSFGNYKLLVTSAPSPTRRSLSREVAVAARANQLAVAAFNVENLNPGNSPSKFRRLAELIVNNLRSPDIISVEEIQDNNGTTNDSVVDATTTFEQLIAAIKTAGGITYNFRSINPVDDQDGGVPGGNIRIGFLFRSDRGLQFIDRPGGGSTNSTTVVNEAGSPRLSFSPGRIDPTNVAFTKSRKPLAGEFTFNGQKLFVIANHFASKTGEQPLFGRFQPPARGGAETSRIQQAQVVHNFVDSILALDSRARVIVLGDLNDYEFSASVNTLKGSILRDLIEGLPPNERYTYVFEGNSQTLDHILVTSSLRSALVKYDAVHVNAEFVDNASDHDPTVAIFRLAAR